MGLYRWYTSMCPLSGRTEEGRQNVEITLKGLVISKYGSAGEFAKAVGWSGRKARDIVSGRQKPTGNDLVKMAPALDIQSPEMFVNIFFKPLSTKWQTEEDSRG